MPKDVLIANMNMLRSGIAAMVREAVDIKNSAPEADNPGEVFANITLAYRHLEDAAMRFGKVIQAADGGKSPLGGPETPGSN